MGRHRTAAGGDRACTALVAVVVCSGPSSDPLSSSSTSRAIAPMGSTTGTTSGRSIVSDPPRGAEHTFKKWGSDYFRRALVINRAQVYLWDGKRDEGLKILDAEDWSAAKDEFHVCVAALRRDTSRVIRLLKTLGTSRPGKGGYRDWPVFKELREMKEFQEAFLEVFGEPLATVTLDSDSPSRPAVEPPEQPASGSVATGE